MIVSSAGVVSKARGVINGCLCTVTDCCNNSNLQGAIEQSGSDNQPVFLIASVLIHDVNATSKFSEDKPKIELTNQDHVEEVLKYERASGSHI